MVFEITLIYRNKKINKKLHGLAVKEIVVVDKRKFSNRVIEKLGVYDVINNKLILNIFRLTFWISKGAKFSKLYEKFIKIFF